MSEIDHKRKDDSFMRRIVIGVTIAIITQAIVTIYYSGKLSNQVGNNTNAISSLVKKIDSQNIMATQIAEIKVTVNFLAAAVTKFGDKLDGVASEQEKRTPFVYGRKRK